MNLSFHGAAKHVTGSCHLLECAGRRILVDCGLFQGSHELHEENVEPFGFDAESVDYLLLTHSHLDHCGRIALLVKRGFRGEIVTTAATRELARLVMLDAAHLQEEEARRRKRRTGNSRNRQARNGPLYTMLDALNALDFFGRAAVYGRRIDLAPGIAVTFYDAGHILGSASVLIEGQEHGETKRILFSGDIGNTGRPLLRDPVVPGGADTVVMETTYGDRLHRPLDSSIEELEEAISDAFGRGGNVIIPTFALERTQEILYFLRQGIANGRLPESLQVFLDSPMAISATEIFKRHPECYEPEIAELFKQGGDPFDLPGLHFVREAAESIKLNEIKSGAVLMAGAGMCTGGRVRHHLRHNISRPHCSVVFVGYAAEGTLARSIIDGATEVHMFGEVLPVRAKIYTVNGFSAHADRDELRSWHEQTGKPARTFLVHGELKSMQSFARHLKGTRVDMPAMHQQFSL